MRELKTQIFALWVHIYFDTAPKSYEEVNVLLRELPVQFIVLDGYRSTGDVRLKALKEYAYLNLQSGQKMKIIVVFSSEYERSAADNSAQGIKSIEVGPWTLDEQIHKYLSRYFPLPLKVFMENTFKVSFQVNM